MQKYQNIITINDDYKDGDSLYDVDGPANDDENDDLMRCSSQSLYSDRSLSWRFAPGVA